MERLIRGHMLNSHWRMHVAMPNLLHPSKYLMQMKPVDPFGHRRSSKIWRRTSVGRVFRNFGAIMQHSKWFKTSITQNWEFQIFERMQIHEARVAGELAAGKRRVQRLWRGSLPLLAGSRVWGDRKLNASNYSRSSFLKLGVQGTLFSRRTLFCTTRVAAEVMVSGAFFR